MSCYKRKPYKLYMTIISAVKTMMFCAALSQHTLTVVITDTSVYLHDLCLIIVHFITSPHCSESLGYSFISSWILFAKYFQPYIESQNPRAFEVERGLWRSGIQPMALNRVDQEVFQYCVQWVFNISRDQGSTMSLMTKLEKLVSYFAVGAHHWLMFSWLSNQILPFL